MKKVFLMIVLGAVSFLYAGSYAGDFILIGSGIRSMGMGGAFSSVADDGSAIYWNTSGIAQLRKPELTLMRAFLYDGLATYDNLIYCQPLPDEVTLGLSWTRLSIDNIPEYSEAHLLDSNYDERITNPLLQLSGVPDSKFDAYDDLFMFAFAKHIHYDVNLGWLFFKFPAELYVGGNIKYIRRKIYNVRADGTGFDASMLFKTKPSVIFDNENLGDFAVGLNFQDIGGTSITWQTASENVDDILFNTKLGLSYSQPLARLQSQIIFSYDLDFVYNQVSHYGMEYQYKNLYAARMGYSEENWTAGLSVKFYNFYIDYAFNRLTDFERNTNRVGLRIQF